MLGDAFNSKNLFISNLLNNQNLLKCLYYTDNDKDILSFPDLSVKDKKKVTKENIYQYRKIPTQDDREQKTYIAIEYGDRDYGATGAKYTSNNIWYEKINMRIFIVSMCEQDVNKYIGSRIDRIEEEIVEMFHKKDNIGSLGYCYVQDSIPLNLTARWIGRMVTLIFVNNQSNTFN